MGKHPPGLNGSRYRCCCNHVNEGALIVGILGLLLTWYNPVSVVAHLVLIIGYLAQNHRFHYCYMVLAWINCILLIAIVFTLIVCMATAIDIFGILWTGAPTNHTYFAASFFVLVILLALQLCFIEIVKRAREYLQKKKEMKRTNYVISTPNVFTAPASVGPAYPSTAPTYTEHTTTSLQAPNVPQDNLYPATNTAA